MISRENYLKLAAIAVERNFGRPMTDAETAQAVKMYEADLRDVAVAHSRVSITEKPSAEIALLR